MNRVIWLVLILASEPLLPTRAVALFQPAQANSGDDEIKVTVSSVNGRTYLTTNFGRLPDGDLRPNCSEDKSIPLPMDLENDWQLLHYKILPGGAPGGELIEPEDPAEANYALAIGDLLISNGPMAGKWRYKSRRAFSHGVLVKWTQEDKSSLQTFIPWAGILGFGIERSQFDAPLCRE